MFVSGVFYLGSGSAAEAHCGGLAYVITRAQPCTESPSPCQDRSAGEGGHTEKRRGGAMGIVQRSSSTWARNKDD
jgi:hypothetical protein